MPNWKEVLHQGSVKTLQWLVYYNDTTGLRAVLESGGDLSSIDLNAGTGKCSFFWALEGLRFFDQSGG